ncbi:bifunctional 3-(3-hydroxy-phenyl)propionate/3-hydroxycinnamic acid hydroxylase [Granulosicoccus sp.]|nr:bifunctional 3-(3-hydroxy-phenyl)propionate/3-hydroxycinnamic acid hydroxylase [Granulosicoccus sp.]MDB4224508.1 bifunctional 3-(3-hydroxy-phenyl)propionate/3-hydroxycinnamic acid hydroxylase [Granulosicoccus sp.]
MNSNAASPSGSAMTNTADVIIVGCGPVGAILGLLLEQCGISSLILERENELYPLPRAVHFDDHIMRVFQTLGMAEAVEAVTRYNPGMRFVDPKNNLLLDWPRPPGVGENGWYSSYRFHQPDLEKILRDKISASNCVELKTGVAVTNVEQGSGYAAVQCQSEHGNVAERYQARYVVGCDGANSLVRKSIGQQVHDFGFNEHWLVIDAVLKHDKPELGDYTIQHCGRHRPATYVRCPGLRRRWEIALKPGEDRSGFDDETILWDLLSDWVTPEEADIERSAVYEFKSQVSEQWRKDRLFIAGDAAHLTPPFMGQGMCAGIRDVSNLAWKLAECCRDETRFLVDRDDERSSKINGLLESYQLERIANVTEYIQTAIELGELINSCSRSSHKGGSSQAESVAEQESDSSTVKMKSLAPTLGAGLGVSLNSAVTGHWIQQPRLSCGNLVDDVVGYKPMLIVEPALWGLYSDKRTLPFVVLYSEGQAGLQDCLDVHEVSSVLVRPDRYILGGARNINELESLISLACQYW